MKNGTKTRPVVLLWQTIREVGALRIFAVYVAFLVLCCLFLTLWEPETFPGFGPALWCCFQTITTVGFGDIVPATTLGRAVIMCVGLSSLFVVALITGVVVSFYNEKMRARQNESFAEFEYNLAHLTELSPKQLREMEESYRRFRAKHPQEVKRSSKYSQEATMESDVSASGQGTEAAPK